MRALSSQSSLAGLTGESTDMDSPIKSANDERGHTADRPSRTFARSQAHGRERPAIEGCKYA